MKQVFVLLWMFLPCSLQQFMYYPEYYYPQPPVIYYDPYAQPCCSPCSLFRITYKCKQRTPSQETSAPVLQTTSQTLPHSESETTMTQNMAHPTQELPTTSASEAITVDGLTKIGIDEKETGTTEVTLPSTTTTMRTLEPSTIYITTSVAKEEARTGTVAEITSSMATEEERISTETATSVRREEARSSTLVETATSTEMTAEVAQTTVTANASAEIAGAETTIKSEEAEGSASAEVAETVDEHRRFSTTAWIYISERGEDTTQSKSEEETTSEHPPTEPTTDGIVDEAEATEAVFENSDISETKTEISSSPVLQYVSTSEDSSAFTDKDDLIQITEKDQKYTMTEAVSSERALLPLRLAPQNVPATTDTITEPEKDFPSIATTQTATVLSYTTKPPRTKRTRKPRPTKPRRKTTTAASTIALSTTTKAPVIELAFFPDVDAV